METIKSIEERAKEAYPAHEYSVLERVMKRGAYIRGAKEQQAIDEEVRLKKSDDMTEAEYDRETAFADWYLKNGKALQHTPMLLSGRGKMLLARLVIGCT